MMYKKKRTLRFDKPHFPACRFHGYSGKKYRNLIYLLSAGLSIYTSTASHAAVCGGLNPVLVVATPVVFGNYNALLSVDLTVNGTITVSCTITLGATLPSFTVSLSSGGSGSFAPRKLSLLGNTLDYNIYTNASYTNTWGDGTGTSTVQSYNTSSNLSAQNFTAYGKIFKNQYAPAGIYLDTLTVTVSY